MGKGHFSALLQRILAEGQEEEDEWEEEVESDQEEGSESGLDDIQEIGSDEEEAEAARMSTRPPSMTGNRRRGRGRSGNGRRY